MNSFFAFNFQASRYFTRPVFCSLACCFLWAGGAGAKEQQRFDSSSSKAQTLPRTSPQSASKTKNADPAYAAFRNGRYITALKLAIEQSKKGEAQAFTLAGRIYEGGLGVKKDLLKAAQWYAGGAERGDLDSQFSLALQLAGGLGVKRDVAQAAALFEAAATQGHRLAQYNLALIHVAGSGVPINMVKAAHWLEKAAKQGEVRAQYDLGTLYLAGSGVKQDKAKAAYWIGKASNAGLGEAELEFGIMLFRGKGLKKDPKRGAKLLLRAARKGNPVAQNRVAKLYAHGLVFKKDPLEAAKWHLIARHQGLADIQLDLQLLRLPKKQQQAAKMRAKIWREQNRAP